MSLVVNNNLMAANVARNLNAHYGRLQTSTQRLSSGLRINSAADDAAGLAIRELQRADIAALHQGARNANDAISMIQVADGSLGIIDEKLIRMKELAEQAATGTYDSTQRLMIESEYQAMASEITRIANATDFNGTKLLDGTLDGEHDGSGLVSTGKMKIHFGTGNNSAEDYYYVTIGEVTSQALGLGNASTWQDVQKRGEKAFKDSLEQQIRNNKDLDEAEKGKLLAAIGKMEENGKYTPDSALEFINNAISGAVDPAKAYELWGAADGENGTIDQGFLKDGKNWVGNSDLMERYLAAAATDPNDNNIYAQYLKDKQAQPTPDDAKLNDTQAWVTAANNTTGTATIDEIWKQYLAGYDPAAQPSAAEAKANDATAWATAEGMVAATSDTDIFTQYLTDLGLQSTAANAKANDVNAWNEAEKKLQDGGTTTPSDAEIFSQYLVDKGAHPTAGDVEKNQPELWAAAKAKVDADQEKKIYGQYLEDKGVPANVTDPATAEANDNAAWITAKTAADQSTPPTDEQIYATYLATKGAAGDIDGAKVDQAAWDAAAAKLGNGDSIDKFWNSLRTTEKQKLQYAWGQAALYNLANAKQGTEPAGYGIGAEPSDFSFSAISGVNKQDANGNNIADTIFQQALKDMHAKVGHMDFAGHTIETQEDAQHALDAINNAIVQKDKIRAHLGATQNRLENTVSNLNIQAENLQAAESRISDVDVATEMTQFVRNQILTQSAVAMLGQANSLPQMAMQLIGG